MSPGCNHLLAALGASDRGRLESGLREVELPARTVLIEPGDTVDRVYFPDTAVIAQQVVDSQGRAMAAAIIGCDGFAGLGACLVGAPSLTRHLVLVPGSVFWVEGSCLLEAMRSSNTLCDLLTGYADALVAETMQTAACLAQHTPEQRLARCLLTCLERGQGAELSIAEDVFSSVIGVDQKQLILAGRTLHSLGLVHYRQGWYGVLDQAGLKELACECYGAVHGKYFWLRSGHGLRG